MAPTTSSNTVITEEENSASLSLLDGIFMTSQGSSQMSTMPGSGFESTSIADEQLLSVTKGTTTHAVERAQVQILPLPSDNPVKTTTPQTNTPNTTPPSQPDPILNTGPAIPTEQPLKQSSSLKPTVQTYLFKGRTYPVVEFTVTASPKRVRFYHSNWLSRTTLPTDSTHIPTWRPSNDQPHSDTDNEENTELKAFQNTNKDDEDKSSILNKEKDKSSILIKDRDNLEQEGYHNGDIEGMGEGEQSILDDTKLTTTTNTVNSLQENNQSSLLSTSISTSPPSLLSPPTSTAVNTQFNTFSSLNDKLDEDISSSYSSPPTQVSYLTNSATANSQTTHGSQKDTTTDIWAGLVTGDQTQQLPYLTLTPDKTSDRDANTNVIENHYITTESSNNGNTPIDFSISVNKDNKITTKNPTSTEVYSDINKGLVSVIPATPVNDFSTNQGSASMMEWKQSNSPTTPPPPQGTERDWITPHWNDDDDVTLNLLSPQSEDNKNNPSIDNSSSSTTNTVLAAVTTTTTQENHQQWINDMDSKQQEERVLVKKVSIDIPLVKGQGGGEDDFNASFNKGNISSGVTNVQGNTATVQVGLETNYGYNGIDIRTRENDDKMNSVSGIIHNIDTNELSTHSGVNLITVMMIKTKQDNVFDDGNIIKSTTIAPHFTSDINSNDEEGESVVMNSDPKTQSINEKRGKEIEERVFHDEGKTTTTTSIDDSFKRISSVLKNTQVKSGMLTTTQQSVIHDGDSNGGASVSDNVNIKTTTLSSLLIKAGGGHVDMDKPLKPNVDEDMNKTMNKSNDEDIGDSDGQHSDHMDNINHDIHIKTNTNSVMLAKNTGSTSSVNIISTVITPNPTATETSSLSPAEQRQIPTTHPRLRDSNKHANSSDLWSDYTKTTSVYNQQLANGDKSELVTSSPQAVSVTPVIKSDADNAAAAVPTHFVYRTYKVHGVDDGNEKTTTVINPAISSSYSSLSTTASSSNSNTEKTLIVDRGSIDSSSNNKDGKVRKPNRNGRRRNDSNRGPKVKLVKTTKTESASKLATQETGVFANSRGRYLDTSGGDNNRNVQKPFTPTILNVISSSTTTDINMVGNSTVINDGVSTGPAIGIIIGCIIGFWIILGPLICIVCRLKDKAKERRSRSQEDEMGTRLVEEMVRMELARGRDKKYQTSVSDTREIEPLKIIPENDYENVQNLLSSSEKAAIIGNEDNFVGGGYPPNVFDTLDEKKGGMCLPYVIDGNNIYVECNEDDIRAYDFRYIDASTPASLSDHKTRSKFTFGTPTSPRFHFGGNGIATPTSIKDKFIFSGSTPTSIKEKFTFAGTPTSIKDMSKKVFTFTAGSPTSIKDMSKRVFNFAGSPNSIKDKVFNFAACSSPTSIKDMAKQAFNFNGYKSNGSVSIDSGIEKTANSILHDLSNLSMGGDIDDDDDDNVDKHSIDTSLDNDNPSPVPNDTSSNDDRGSLTSSPALSGISSNNACCISSGGLSSSHNVFNYAGCISGIDTAPVHNAQSKNTEMYNARNTTHNNDYNAKSLPNNDLDTSHINNPTNPIKLKNPYISQKNHYKPPPLGFIDTSKYLICNNHVGSLEKGTIYKELNGAECNCEYRKVGDNEVSDDGDYDPESGTESCKGCGNRKSVILLSSPINQARYSSNASNSNHGGGKWTGDGGGGNNIVKNSKTAEYTRLYQDTTV